MRKHLARNAEGQANGEGRRKKQGEALTAGTFLTRIV
jgi:hypothetical protein